MKQEGRIDYIDAAKGIGILLVLLGHLLPDKLLIKTMIYSFSMPLFFILSGITTRPQKLSAKLEKRFTSILVPYVIWVLIFSGFSFKKLAYIAYGTNEALNIIKSNKMLWFLPCMFFSSLLSLAIKNISVKTKRPQIILVLCMIVSLAVGTALNTLHNNIIIEGSAIGLPLGADVMFLATAFMLFGTIISDFLNGENIERINNAVLMIISVLLILVSFFGIYVRGVGGLPLMGQGDVNNFFLYFIIGSVVSSGVILFLKQLNRLTKLSPLVWCGKNSMGMYLLHRTLVYKFKAIYLGHPNVLVFIALFGVLICFCVIGVIIINRFCPALFGKKQ